MLIQVIPILFLTWSGVGISMQMEVKRMGEEVILEMKDIVKDFPGVRALDHVNFRVKKGTVLALCGENGAGKSTLVKVLSGVWPYPTYEGKIILDGEEEQFSNTREAEDAGIGIIHQELNLIPELTVAENIYLDRQPTNKFGTIAWEKMYADAKEVLQRLNMEIDPQTPLKTLTVGKQQMVEIAKALSHQTRIMVFDEPTSALTNTEVKELFRVIRELRASGVSIIYISHKMDEIKEIADEVTVLRDGASIGDVAAIADITLDQIISRMVGRKLEDMFPDRIEEMSRKKTLEVKNITVDDPKVSGKYLVKDVSFSAYTGEILGIAGLMGAGRTELVNAIFGVYGKKSIGELILNGEKITINSPKEAISRGIALVTEDRKELGLLLEQDLAFNISLPLLDDISKKGIVDQIEEHKIAEKYVEELNVKTPSLEVYINKLSGGNQQKVVIGKWLATKPKVLILDEPTRGIDVGAKVEVYRLMNKLVAQGVTVIMISSELPEILGMSDRILVMNEGLLAAELSKEEATGELIMEYATRHIKKGAEIN